MRDGDDPGRWASSGSGTTDDDMKLLDPGRQRDHGDDGFLTIPIWTIASILLGLLALSGSMTAIVLAGAAAATWWLVRAADAPDVPRARPPRGRSFGGAGTWP